MWPSAFHARPAGPGGAAGGGDAGGPPPPGPTRQRRRPGPVVALRSEGSRPTRGPRGVRAPIRTFLETPLFFKAVVILLTQGELISCVATNRSYSPRMGCGRGRVQHCHVHATLGDGNVAGRRVSTGFRYRLFKICRHCLGQVEQSVRFFKAGRASFEHKEKGAFRGGAAATPNGAVARPPKIVGEKTSGGSTIPGTARTPRAPGGVRRARPRGAFMRRKPAKGGRRKTSTSPARPQNARPRLHDDLRPQYSLGAPRREDMLLPDDHNGHRIDAPEVGGRNSAGNCTWVWTPGAGPGFAG